MCCLARIKSPHRNKSTLSSKSYPSILYNAMKYILILCSTLVLTNTRRAQRVSPSIQVLILSKVTSDGVWFRWAPVQFETWKSGLIAGIISIGTRYRKMGACISHAAASNGEGPQASVTAGICKAWYHSKGNCRRR